MLLSKRLFSAAVLVGLVLFASGWRGCGYKPVTKSGLPTHIKTVAVPAFQNQALRYTYLRPWLGALGGTKVPPEIAAEAQRLPESATAIIKAARTKIFA